MGDANDAGVLILFAPLLLAPVFALAKAICSRILWSRYTVPSWRQIALVAVAESFLPLATIIANGFLLIMIRLVAPALLEARWFRLSGFLCVLYLANCAANYVLFERGLMGRAVPEQRVAVARSLLQGMLPTIIFVIAWVTLGNLLAANA